jgi:hypothetical protein
MKVLIVGSTDFPDSDCVRQEFGQACKDIGAALATAGHELIVGSSNPNTADRSAVEGVASVAGKHTVFVIRPDAGSTPFSDLPVPNQERIQFRNTRCRGPWTVVSIHQILAADAVIVIGGGRGTAQSGYCAPILGIPVLAVPAFGGAAKDVGDHLSRDYDRVPGLKELATDLREKWRPEYADSVVTAATALVKARPYSRRRPFQGFVDLLMSAVILAGWGALFYLPRFQGVISFFLLLLLSALLGTVLRRALRSFSPSGQVQEGPSFWSDTTCSLLVAFGLMLLAFIGDLALTGNLDLLKPQPADFQRVGIVFSLIGFCAGFQMEKASRQLAAKLGSTVLEDGA